MESMGTTIRRVLMQRGALVYFLAVAAFLSVVFPMTLELMAIVSFLYWRKFMRQKLSLPFKLPKAAEVIDENEVTPDGKTAMAAGIFHIGIDRETQEQLWLTNSDIRQHMGFFATTGGGKTELILGILTNALSWGSGCLMVDGKGDTKTYASLYSLARRFGRDDDVLVLSFMTGGKRIKGHKGPSNTLNMLATGDYTMLSEMFKSLMSSGKGGGDMWEQRAQSLVTVLLKPLTEKRDAGLISLDVKMVRDHIPLKKIVQMYFEIKKDEIDPDTKVGKKSGMSKSSEEMIRGFLETIPGFNWAKAEAGEEQEQKTNEQYGFLSMQLTRPLSSLADDYGHIFGTQNGEIDLFDVVVNRRLMMVLLPALEKSGAEVANLGKIVVANLKALMGSTLGDKVEGTKEAVLDVRVTNSPSPFITALDEVGYYTVDGMAVMMAQARSLGFSIIIAAQDIPAMKRITDTEAPSMIGNAALKGFGRMEDMNETAKLAIETGGKMKYMEAGGFTGVHGLFKLGYRDSLNASVREEDRVNPLDLKAQTEGQFTLMYKDVLVRAQTFYPGLKQVADFRRNHFIPLKLEGYNDIEASVAMDQVMKNLDNPNFTLAAEVAKLGFDRLPDEACIAGVVMQCRGEPSMVRRAGAAVIAASLLLRRQLPWDQESEAEASRPLEADMAAAEGAATFDSFQQGDEIDAGALMQNIDSDPEIGALTARPRHIADMVTVLNHSMQMAAQMTDANQFEELFPGVAGDPVPPQIVQGFLPDGAEEEMLRLEREAGGGEAAASAVQRTLEKVTQGADMTYPADPLPPPPDAAQAPVVEALDMLANALTGHGWRGR